ncbi:MAG: ATP-dependent protease LonB [Clostridia bacterium]|nr:ATP-dependent protease LonB [Clostridia bacterium]
MLQTFILTVQFFFTMVMGIYFLNLLRSQHSGKGNLEKDSDRELEKLHRLRAIKLTTPLSERTRPKELSDIVGQEDGLRALRAALCGPNPQHVLIYGPPGVGKTAAARVVLNEAIRLSCSPFESGAKFVEMDATTMRFDERGIADPLIGSVHDPIYQGAGAYGPAGVPQPKPGAVTKAHGGVLFIDEIGELHPIQMNKLLKVLEDRKVFLESAYYSPGNRDIPAHVHEIFQKGLPADFRLVGATTRSPDEIPPAIRSRCVEIFFRSLTREEVTEIAKTAAQKGGFRIDVDALCEVADYAQNGRDAVNVVQIAGSAAMLEERIEIKKKDVEWVLEFGHYTPRLDQRVPDVAAIGLVNGLAVSGAREGRVMEIEAYASPCAPGEGSLSVTGIVEQEEFSAGGQTLTKKSSARASVENMLTVLNHRFGVDSTRFHLHVNFPGGMPVDGPSAGIAIFTAVYSAVFEKPIPAKIAMTGELSVHGKVKPVGGVREKIEAAKNAGAETVYIPRENDKEILHTEGVRVIAVDTAEEVLDRVFRERSVTENVASSGFSEGELISANAV